MVIKIFTGAWGYTKLMTQSIAGQTVTIMTCSPNERITHRMAVPIFIVRRWATAHDGFCLVRYDLLIRIALNSSITIKLENLVLPTEKENPG